MIVLTPNQVNDIFEKFHVNEGVSDRYYPKSDIEFTLLFIRKLMNGSAAYVYNVDVSITKSLNSFGTLVYHDIVFHDDLGLIISGKRAASLTDIMKDSVFYLCKVEEHLKAQVGTEVSNVKLSDLLGQVQEIVERESDFEAHRDAVTKALSKAQGNIDRGSSISITQVGEKLEVTYKG